MPEYPWYANIGDDNIEQGDIFTSCPVFIPPPDIDLSDNSSTVADFRREKRDVIVISQTYDLVKGREKLSEVLLCAIWNQSEITEGLLASPKGMEDARRGYLLPFHLLARCESPDAPNREIRIVDFRRIYSLPIAFIRKRAEGGEQRLRLLPPYREHLSQAFARFFMRVGLPVDIPPFKRK